MERQPERLARQPLRRRQGRAGGPDRFSSAGRQKRSETSDAVWEAFAGFTGFFWSDPPLYTLDREAWSRAFKPRLKGIPSLVQGIVDELLDRVETGSTVDAVSALAFPLPATVVFDLLGVPREDRDMFREVFCGSHRRR